MFNMINRNKKRGHSGEKDVIREKNTRFESNSYAPCHKLYHSNLGNGIYYYF